MAKNDVILLDSILQQAGTTSTIRDPGELFERFVLEQVLKSYDLSGEELDFGWTDGNGDGGIDGFYTLVNGRLITDPSDFAWPRSGAEISVYLITCKHHATFQQAPLDALLASLQELFDLEVPSLDLKGTYSPEIIKSRESFTAAFKHLSLFRPRLDFYLIYASRGDTGQLGQSVSARGGQLEDLFRSYFSASSAEFRALGASELVELHRQVKNFALDLPIVEYLTAGPEGYVVLARLVDFCAFVRDESGQLRRYLFDSNVRAFLGGNLVNLDIASTLADRAAPNFWWLNNGVTLLATSASLVGKTLKLKDIQIVNGLQTTESIHRHFADPTASADETRTLLVKVIVSQEESVRDQVIRATNNQSSVQPAALHATDRIQRSIEEILLRHEWYYERRTNFYKNEGRPEARILSPLVMATGAVALMLKNPARSSKLKQKHLRAPEAYQTVYSESFPLDAWPVVACLIRSAENAITGFQNSKRGGPGQYLASWRGLLAFSAAVRLMSTFQYSLEQLASLDTSRITDDFMSECWETLSLSANGISSAKVSDNQAMRVLSVLAVEWKVEGHPLDGQRELPKALTSRLVGRSGVTSAFLDEVESQLPPQPWKPGIHFEVARSLSAAPNLVSRAIQVLIARGRRHHQRNGVVFDSEGNEIMRDPNRAPKPAENS